MIPQNETFNGTWRYDHQFCTESGFRQHYIDEGEGEALVCYMANLRGGIYIET